MKKIYVLTTVVLMIATAIFSMTPVTADVPQDPPWQAEPSIYVYDEGQKPWLGYPWEVINFKAKVKHMGPPYQWVWTFTFDSGQTELEDFTVESGWINDNPWDFNLSFDYVCRFYMEIDVTNGTGKTAHWPMALTYTKNYTDISLYTDAGGPYYGVSDQTGTYHNPDVKVPVHFRGSGQNLYSFPEAIEWDFGDGNFDDGWNHDYYYSYDGHKGDPNPGYYRAKLTYTIQWGETSGDVWIDEDNTDVFIYSNCFYVNLDIQNTNPIHELLHLISQGAWTEWKVKYTTTQGSNYVYTPPVWLDVKLERKKADGTWEDVFDFFKYSFGPLAPGSDTGWRYTGYYKCDDKNEGRLWRVAARIKFYESVMEDVMHKRFWNFYVI